MTKKHLIHLAANLRAAHPQAPRDTPQVQAWIAACNAVADTATAMNPAFDRAKFLFACGV